MKGEISGMRTLIALPESLIETMKAIIEKRERDESESVESTVGNAP
jgi:hypothetical protein